MYDDDYTYSDNQLKRQKKLWNEIDATVDKAAAVQFDGCHKIYVIMEADTANNDYPHVVDLSLGDNREQAKKLLRNWWKESCGSRFIQRIDGDGNDNSQYHDLIGQCETAYMMAEDE